MNQQAVIIGAGIGGLATANLLAKAGYRVTVVEQHAAAGGRAGVLESDGFRFDTGPSWYLMPDAYTHYFDLLDEKVEDHLDLVRLDPAYRVFFDKRAPVNITNDLAENMRTFDSIEPGAGKQLGRYLDRAGETYQLAMKEFLYNPFIRRHDVLSRSALTQLPTLASLLLQPIHRYVGRYVRNLQLQQILEYPMVFLGTSPFKAPALYHLMSHMDFTQGVFYPRGGIYEIIKALQSIGERLGVQYRFNSPVTAITTDGNTATGVRIKDGEEIAADIVVSDADLHFTETQLLPPNLQTYPETYWQSREAGPSALLLYLGIKGSLPELTHHNLFFVDEWHQNFAAIFETKTIPDRPSLYVCKPSTTDPTVAPEGHENVFVLIPLPADSSIGHEQSEPLSDKILSHIEQTAGISDLRERIVVKHMYTPADFAQQLNSWQGTALGLSHRLNQSAMFRPANQSKKVTNLYYAGANNQPGVGMPMCLIGAELVYKRLTNDRSAKPLERITPHA